MRETWLVEDAGNARDRLRARIARALEQALRGARTPATSRLPQASVSAKFGRLRPGATSVIDVGLRRRARPLPRSRACRPRSRARRGRRRRARSAAGTPPASACGAAELELLGDPARERPLRHVPDKQLAVGGDRLRERRVLLQLAADERERRRRARALRGSRRSPSRPRAFQPSTPLDERSAGRRRRTGRARCRPRRRRRRLRLAASKQLDRVRVEAARAAGRRARSTFGRSVPAIR